MGSFGIGAEQRPSAVVSQETLDLNPVVGRSGPASKELVAKSGCLHTADLVLGFRTVCFHSSSRLICLSYVYLRSSLKRTVI